MIEKTVGEGERLGIENNPEASQNAQEASVWQLQETQGNELDQRRGWEVDFREHSIQSISLHHGFHQVYLSLLKHSMVTIF